MSANQYFNDQGLRFCHIRIPYFISWLDTSWDKILNDCYNTPWRTKI